MVVVMTDDQEVGSLAAMPKVRRLVGREGTTFTDAVATTPECCPSRATFLTGQYEHNHGVLSNSAPRGGYPALDGENTLPVWLRAAGYRTAWIGRYLNEYGNESKGQDPLEVPPGWDEWRAPVEHTDFQMYGYTLNENGVLRTYGDAPRDYATDVYARQAARFVEDSAERHRPFFLTVAPLAPHDEGVLEDADAARNPRPAPRHAGTFEDRPLPRPPAFNEAAIADKPPFVAKRDPLGADEIEELTRRHRSRLESLLAVDDMVGRLVRALRRSGELDRTILVFTSDQGFVLGEHRLVGKKSPYEESVRVPLLIRGPGFPAGRGRAQPVANVDLAPTIAAAAAAEPGLRMDGIDLRPVAADPSFAADRQLLLEFREKRHYVAVRTSRHVLVRHEDGATELYDLRDDPHQLRNLAGRRRTAAVERRLGRDLSQLRSCAGRSCVRPRDVDQGA